MEVFWTHGYEATSLKQLVQKTGASRQSIYSDFGGKRELFLAALECYQHEVVSPAFSQVEQAGAKLGAVEAYFRYQIERAANDGLPGPGCLIANTITEVAPHDVEIYKRVNAHNDRLFSGFSKAFRNEIQTGNTRRQAAINTDAIATMTVIFAQGLWSNSRVINDAAQLYLAVDHFLALVKLELHR
jgi:TetR/AcrR family transcriptional repressor of nem operon